MFLRGVGERVCDGVCGRGEIVLVDRYRGKLGGCWRWWRLLLLLWRGGKWW